MMDIMRMVNTLIRTDEFDKENAALDARESYLDPGSRAFLLETRRQNVAYAELMGYFVDSGLELTDEIKASVAYNELPQSLRDKSLQVATILSPIMELRRTFDLLG